MIQVRDKEINKNLHGLIFWKRKKQIGIDLWRNTLLRWRKWG